MYKEIYKRRKKRWVLREKTQKEKLHGEKFFLSQREAH